MSQLMDQPEMQRKQDEPDFSWYFAQKTEQTESRREALFDIAEGLGIAAIAWSSFQAGRSSATRHNRHPKTSWDRLSDRRKQHIMNQFSADTTHGLAAGVLAATGPNMLHTVETVPDGWGEQTAVMDMPTVYGDYYPNGMVTISYVGNFTNNQVDPDSVTSINLNAYAYPPKGVGRRPINGMDSRVYGASFSRADDTNWAVQFAHRDARGNLQTYAFDAATPSSINPGMVGATADQATQLLARIQNADPTDLVIADF